MKVESRPEALHVEPWDQQMQVIGCMPPVSGFHCCSSSVESQDPRGITKRPGGQYGISHLRARRNSRFYYLVGVEKQGCRAASRVVRPAHQKRLAG
jgi:hypothetical protein